MESVSRVLESGIPNATGTRNPSSTDTESEYMAWNPDSKIVLDPFTWGDMLQKRKLLSDLSS